MRNVGAILIARSSKKLLKIWRINMSKETNFETSMEQLEKIVQELEKGDLNLDDSIKKFEQGMKISKECNQFLENAEKKITVLINNNDNILEEEF